MAIPTPPNINLVRGNAVHETFDEFFNMNWIPNGETYRKYCLDRATNIFDKIWKEKMTEIVISEEDEKRYYVESKFMVTRFINNLCDNIEDGLASTKYSNPTHGYNSHKPKFKEFWLDDETHAFIPGDKKRTQIPKELRTPMEETLHVGGFLDNCNVAFDGTITLVDYKTSTTFKDSFNPDYVLQLSIYAYLWNKQFNELPDYLCINYLKYNKSYYFEVTPSLIHKAVLEIKKMRMSIMESGLDKEKYLIKKNNLCKDYCEHYKKCFGSDINGSD